MLHCIQETLKNDILGVIKIKRIFCKLTGGHKLDDKTIVITPLVDGLMSVTIKCKKCDYTKTQAIPLTNNEWIKNINRVKEYEKYGTIS